MPNIDEEEELVHQFDDDTKYSITKVNLREEGRFSNLSQEENEAPLDYPDEES